MLEKKFFKVKFPPFAVYGLFSFCILITAFLLVILSVPEGDFLVLKGAIGDKSSLLNLSFVATAVCLINLAASWVIFKKDRVASHILGALAVSISAIILLKVTVIVFSY
jgi:hypothetical protein